MRSTILVLLCVAFAVVAAQGFDERFRDRDFHNWGAGRNNEEHVGPDGRRYRYDESQRRWLDEQNGGGNWNNNNNNNNWGAHGNWGAGRAEEERFDNNDNNWYRYHNGRWERFDRQNNFNNNNNNNWGPHANWAAGRAEEERFDNNDNNWYRYHEGRWERFNNPNGWNGNNNPNFNNPNLFNNPNPGFGSFANNLFGGRR